MHLAVGRNPMGRDSAKRIAKARAVLVRDGSAANVRRELEKPRTFEGDVEIWVSGSWRLPRIQRGPPVEAEPSGSALGNRGMRHHEENHLRLWRQHWG